MTDDAGATFSYRFSPQLTRWLAFGWAAAMAFVFLFQYEAWLAPLQLAHLIVANLPALRVGPHFGAFWAARFLDVACVVAIFAAAFPVGVLIIRKGGLFALATGLWVVAVA